MKKIFLVSVLLLIIAFMWGCSMGRGDIKKSADMLQAKPQNKQKINLYFTDKENSKILSETREVVVEDTKKLPKIAIQELLKGPVSLEMKKAIPEGTKLLDIKQEGTLVTVNFSKEYYKSGDIGEIVARFSLVNTLSDLPNIQKVLILVEGKELIGPSGKPFGPLGKDDVVFEAAPSEKDKTTLTLYFAGNGWENLVPEKRVVVVKDNEPVEKYVIEELIKGPKDKNLFATVPAQTKLLSIETKEGICFVNLSNEFRTEHPGGSAGEIMTIYSIVNSLTELEHINKVQFLIEGQKIETFKGHMALKEPVERDPEIIKK
ncbi:MAG: germination protein [Petroclostridium sp.]|jgi:germination protein M|uniref:GerMN domain-containing protein n=1 Tax=Petroclostridium xylanilyticum TaxID=1792311 RepID=UPI000B987E2B|nr:GerMN domain-containing protein [Petroclostridium xylanilyticum]MBZ4645117.1 Lipoprotein LpqB, GerMN domain protein [Clostridia bacterium]MDK2810752.1 germination protein [Petroclostridium sp.]